jgi:hypothetical protein
MYRVRKNCLWRGKEFRYKGYNLVAWDLVRRPKDKGGLGVINLSIQNAALLLKHLDKFYKKADVQWVKLIWDKYYNGIVPHLDREKGFFWWKDILRLNTIYRGIAMCSPAKGNTISFWGDLINGSIHSLKFPNLFEYVKDPNMSLFLLRQSHSLLENFRILYPEMLLMNSCCFRTCWIFCLLSSMMNWTPGLLFGGALLTHLADTISLSSESCIQKNLSSGFGNPNVSLRLNSLLGCC